MNKKKLIFDFIKRHNLAILATVTSVGKPEAAVAPAYGAHLLEIDTGPGFELYTFTLG